MVHTSSLLCSSIVVAFLRGCVRRVCAALRAGPGGALGLHALILLFIVIAGLIVPVAPLIFALSVLVICQHCLLAALQVVHVRDILAANVLPFLIVGLLAFLLTAYIT